MLASKSWYLTTDFKAENGLGLGTVKLAFLQLTSESKGRD